MSYFLNASYPLEANCLCTPFSIHWTKISVERSYLILLQIWSQKTHTLTLFLNRTLYVSQSFVINGGTDFGISVHAYFICRGWQMVPTAMGNSVFPFNFWVWRRREGWSGKNEKIQIIRNEIVIYSTFLVVGQMVSYNKLCM